MITEENRLLGEAQLGIEAEAFMRSQIGRYLVQRAQNEIEEETALLIDADPDDIKTGRDIRNRIERCRMFLTWMTEAVNVGRKAHEELRELDD
jgi:hypothetical protein